MLNSNFILTVAFSQETYKTSCLLVQRGLLDLTRATCQLCVCVMHVHMYMYVCLCMCGYMHATECLWCSENTVECHALLPTMLQTASCSLHQISGLRASECALVTASIPPKGRDCSCASASALPGFWGRGRSSGCVQQEHCSLGHLLALGDVSS